MRGQCLHHHAQPFPHPTPDAEAGPPVVNLAVIYSLGAFGLITNDHIACGTSGALLPHTHALGQVLAALALYSATVLSAYLRLQERGVPSEVVWHAGFLPQATRLEKDHTR